MLYLICPECGVYGETKPNVVFFGESAPNYKKMFDVFSMPQKGDIILVIGTSGLVISVDWIVQGTNINVHSILINKNDSHIDESAFDVVHKDSAGVVLPMIKQKILDYLNRQE